MRKVALKMCLVTEESEAGSAIAEVEHVPAREALAPETRGCPSESADVCARTAATIDATWQIGLTPATARAPAAIGNR